jgi:anti-sigma-K factor RskA
MSDIDLHHLAAAYTLDALNAAERAQFEEHYATCDICRTEVVEFRETAAELASVSATPARPEVKSAVMAEIAKTRQLSPLPMPVVGLASRPSRPLMMTVLAAAAAVVLFVAGAAIFGSSGDDFGDEIAAVLSAPDGFVELSSDGPGTVNVAWRDGRAVVIGEGLPKLGSDEAYELWVIDDAGAHPTRLLDRADGGELRRIVDIARVPRAWGITVEPSSGSETPTEPIVFIADV